jgi:hypothetical protein
MHVFFHVSFKLFSHLRVSLITTYSYLGTPYLMNIFEILEDSVFYLLGVCFDFSTNNEFLVLQLYTSPGLRYIHYVFCLATVA